MRTQTEVAITINTLNVTENLYPDPAGFLIKVFMSCSRAQTKIFKVNSNQIKINQTLKIKNVIAKELEFWLCATDNKIIAVGTLPIAKDCGECTLQLQMLTTDFGKLATSIEVRQAEIEKEQYVEPDEELLKKEEDPILKKQREEQEAKAARQAIQQAEAAKLSKKPAVTLTQFKRKDEPFV